MYPHKLEGIIINRRGVNEADRFLTILTKDEGKLSVYARSVRTLRSKRAGTLDLFNLIRFEVVGRGERKTLTSVELVDGYRLGKKKLPDISRLFTIAELIDSLIPEAAPHPEAYDLVATALTHLHRFETPDYLLRFKKKLLLLLGYGEASVDIDSYIESILEHPLRVTI